MELTDNGDVQTAQGHATEQTHLGSILYRYQRWTTDRLGHQTPDTREGLQTPEQIQYIHTVDTRQGLQTDWDYRHQRKYSIYKYIETTDRLTGTTDTRENTQKEEVETDTRTNTHTVQSGQGDYRQAGTPDTRANIVHTVLKTDHRHQSKSSLCINTTDEQQTDWDCAGRADILLRNRLLRTTNSKRKVHKYRTALVKQGLQTRYTLGALTIEVCYYRKIIGSKCRRTSMDPL